MRQATLWPLGTNMDSTVIRLNISGGRSCLHTNEHLKTVEEEGVQGWPWGAVSELSLQRKQKPAEL